MQFVAESPGLRFTRKLILIARPREAERGGQRRVTVGASPRAPPPTLTCGVTVRKSILPPQVGRRLEGAR